MFRRLQAIALATILIVAAFSTGWDFLFYLLYLGILIVGGSYVLVRLGLSDLEDDCRSFDPAEFTEGITKFCLYACRGCEPADSVDLPRFPRERCLQPHHRTTKDNKLPPPHLAPRWA